MWSCGFLNCENWNGVERKNEGPNDFVNVEVTKFTKKFFLFFPLNRAVGNIIRSVTAIDD